MAIVWLNKKQKDGLATFNETSITLNKTALVPMETANMVMIGLDETNHEIIIKPLNDNQAMRGDIEIDSMYKVTINSSYARITSKDVISEIENALNLNFDVKKGKKYKTRWDAKENILIVNMREEEK